MSILDSVLGGLMGGQGGQQSPVGGILSSLLGGGGQAGAQAGGASGPMAGGIGGLLQRFQQAGLGNVAQSWVGGGQNQPVSPQQLQSVFGEQQVNQWAQQSNMQPQDLLSQLSQHLPNAVDQMTPNGQVSSNDSPFDAPGVKA